MSVLPPVEIDCKNILDNSTKNLAEDLPNGVDENTTLWYEDVYIIVDRWTYIFAWMVFEWSCWPYSNLGWGTTYTYRGERTRYITLNREFDLNIYNEVSCIFRDDVFIKSSQQLYRSDSNKDISIIRLNYHSQNVEC